MAINQSSKQYTTTYQGSAAPDKAGFITLMAGAALPSGWLYCDGAAVSRTTYSELFAAIGTTYGVGDNSTTFNLPSLSVVIDMVTRQYIIKPYSDITSAASVGLSNIGGAKVNTYLDYDTIATPANPDSGDYRTYFKSDGKFYKKDSSGTETEIGSGSSVGDPTFVNYVSNPTFETGATTGWDRYLLVSGVLDDFMDPPVFGSSTAVTLSANSTTPLHGVYDLKVAKPASNIFDNGFSYPFSLDRADRNSTIVVSFDGDTTDSNYVSGHIDMYILDETFGYTIAGPIPLKKDTITKPYQITFTASGPGSTAYKLLFHWAGTASTAVNLYFDNFRVTAAPPYDKVIFDTDLSSQTNCTITTGDINVFKSTTTGIVNFLQIDLGTISITASASSFSFILPTTIPRPTNIVRMMGFVYDATLSVGTTCVFSLDSSGGLTISKADGGTFTGGTNNSYVRAFLSWMI